MRPKVSLGSGEQTGGLTWVLDGIKIDAGPGGNPAPPVPRGPEPRRGRVRVSTRPARTAAGGPVPRGLRYGGFPTALLPLARRAEPAAVIGEEV